jgi:hypothetical protein
VISPKPSYLITFKLIQTAPVMLFFESLPWAALLLAPAHCSVKRQSPEEASIIISEVEAFVTEIPSILDDDGPALVSELASLIGEIDPSGVVGDIPSLISAYYPDIESYVDELISEAIPPGAVPTDIAAEIPTLVSEILPALVTDIDAAITELPSTLPLSALPGLVSAYGQIVESEVEAEASELVPILSSALFALAGTASTSASTSTGTTSPASAVSTSANATLPAPPAITSFSSAGSTWKAEIGLVVGFAVVVALL